MPEPASPPIDGSGQEGCKEWNNNIMEWNRNDLARLALPSCSSCGGFGVVEAKGEVVPCKCALRAAFRVRHARFRQCVDVGKYRGRVSFERNASGRSNRGAWGRKEEEFMADFSLVARRSLDASHYRLFRYHFLLGADAKLCCKRLSISNGAFFHAIYRIESVLGYVFMTLEPYALYPPRDYFGLHSMLPVQSSIASSGPQAQARMRAELERAVA